MEGRAEIVSYLAACVSTGHGHHVDLPSRQIQLRPTYFITGHKLPFISLFSLSLYLSISLSLLPLLLFGGVFLITHSYLIASK